jgi:hypothetical protein
MPKRGKRHRRNKKSASKSNNNNANKSKAKPKPAPATTFNGKSVPAVAMTSSMSMAGRANKLELQLKQSKPQSQHSTVEERKRSLEKQLATRNVKNALNKRPEMDTLVNGGILQQSNIADKIQGVAKQLKKRWQKTM